MAEKAHVSDIERLEQFRSSLVVFLERAGTVLNEVSDEVKRTRIWLQSEQKLRIAHEIRRKEKELETIEQALFSARLSNLRETKSGHQMQINKKRREIRELESKLRAVKAWLQNFDSKVETEARKVDKLRSMLDHDMAGAVQFLTETSKNLRAYAEGGDSVGGG